MLNEADQTENRYYTDYRDLTALSAQ